MTTGKKCMVGGCYDIAVSRDLCAKHLKRWQRHGHVLETRPADWGAREKHPLYRCWNGLMRFYRPKTAPRWHDFWNFVADLGDSRPSTDHALTRRDGEMPFGPQNFYWRTPSVEAGTKRAATYTRKWRAANPDRSIDIEMRRRYGISFDAYKAMFEAQDGKCAICGQEETRVDHRTKKVSRLAVDHDHKTNTVRALLCGKCNNLLGRADDDPDRLRAAIAYLERHAAPALACDAPIYRHVAYGRREDGSIGPIPDHGVPADSAWQPPHLN